MANRIIQGTHTIFVCWVAIYGSCVSTIVAASPGTGKNADGQHWARNSAETQLIAYKSWHAAASTKYTPVPYTAPFGSLVDQPALPVALNGFMLLTQMAQSAKASPSQVAEFRAAGQPHELNTYTAFEASQLQELPDLEDVQTIRREGVVAGPDGETSAPYEVAVPTLETLDGIVWPANSKNHYDSSSLRDDESPWHPMFHLHTQLGRGAQGDVWQAVRVDKHGQPDVSVAYVLKRLFSSKAAALLSGVREAYFGSRLQQLSSSTGFEAIKHVIARFETHFERLLETEASAESTTSRATQQPPQQRPRNTGETPYTGEQLQTAVRLYEATDAAGQEAQPAIEHLPAVLRMLLPPPQDGLQGGVLPAPGDGAAQLAKVAAVRLAGLLPAAPSGSKLLDGVHRGPHTDSPLASTQASRAFSAAQPNAAETGGGSTSEGGGETERALELWLVFRDEGVSLSSLMFLANRDPLSGMASVLPGGLWQRLSSSPRQPAARLTQALLLQLLVAVDAIHSAGIVHRDVKLSNVFLQSLDSEQELHLDTTPPVQLSAVETAQAISGMQLRLGDFGSALDVGLPPSTLFAPPGAGEWDLTIAYAAPEVLVGAAYLEAGTQVLRCFSDAPPPSSASAYAPPAGWHWPVRGEGAVWPPQAYDAWSIGVSILELSLAQQPGGDLFPLPQRWAAMLQLRLQETPAKLLSLFGGLQQYPWAEQVLKGVVAEHRWNTGKAALLSRWLAVCLVPVSTLQEYTQSCSEHGLAAGRAAQAAVTMAAALNSTAVEDCGDGAVQAIEALLRAASSCLNLQAALSAASQSMIGHCSEADSGANAHVFLRQLRAAHWHQVCRYRATPSHGNRHTEPWKQSTRPSKRAQRTDACKNAPVAELQRPVGSLGAVGESLLLQLLHPRPDTRKGAVSIAAKQLEAELRHAARSSDK